VLIPIREEIEKTFQGNRNEKSLDYGFVRFPPTQRNTLSTVSSQG
jgi:hypothetical protein